MAILNTNRVRMQVNDNPTGSSTCVVTMPSHNPFERRTLARSGGGSAMMPGMGYSAIDPDTGMTWSGSNRDLMTGERAEPRTDWEGLITGILKPVVNNLTTNLIRPTATQPPTALPPPQIHYIGNQPQPQPQPQQPAPKTSMTPWIIGGAAVLGVVVLMMAMKK